MLNPNNYPTWQQVEAQLESDDCEGFCLSCGAEAFGIEPDATKYTCEHCGEKEVYGTGSILIMQAFTGGNE
jgi:predicted RNA-binding Zn-ribbon protein involved in translation (DUF1610 family)